MRAQSASIVASKYILHQSKSLPKTSGASGLSHARDWRQGQKESVTTRASPPRSRKKQMYDTKRRRKDLRDKDGYQF